MNSYSLALRFPLYWLSLDLCFLWALWVCFMPVPFLPPSSSDYLKRVSLSVRPDFLATDSSVSNRNNDARLFPACARRVWLGGPLRKYTGFFLPCTPPPHCRFLFPFFYSRVHFILLSRFSFCSFYLPHFPILHLPYSLLCPLKTSTHQYFICMPIPLLSFPLGNCSSAACERADAAPNFPISAVRYPSDQPYFSAPVLYAYFLSYFRCAD